jgi:hypothetical protein
MTESYPLHWPDGWPRTPGREYNWKLKRATNDSGYRDIREQVRMLGGRDLVISTNLRERRGGGDIIDSRSSRDDPGVAVYFRRGQRQIVMARDAFTTVAQNLRSMALAIEYLRGLERHGGATMMERAFEGFAQLPPPSSGPVERPWYEVLGFKAHEADALRTFASHTQINIINVAYRDLAKKFHSDIGGDDAAMAELNGARDRALKELGG